MIVQRAPDPPIDPQLLKAARDAGIFALDIEACSSCQQDHQGVTTSTFDTPIVQAALLGPSLTFAHWATCPETGEMLMIEFIPSGDILDAGGLPPEGTT